MVSYLVPLSWTGVKYPSVRKQGRSSVRDAGLEPISGAIRGGTDGSRLTEFGTPCPNIFCGMQNVHGPLEWVSVQDMARATQVALNLAGLVAQKG